MDGNGVGWAAQISLWDCRPIPSHPIPVPHARPIQSHDHPCKLSAELYVFPSSRCPAIMWPTYHWKPLQYSTVIISASYPSIQSTDPFHGGTKAVASNWLLLIKGGGVTWATPFHRQLTVTRKRCQKTRTRPTEAREGQQPDAHRVEDAVAEAWPGNMVPRPSLTFQRIHDVFQGR